MEETKKGIKAKDKRKKKEVKIVVNDWINYALFRTVLDYFSAVPNG